MFARFLMSVAAGMLALAGCANSDYFEAQGPKAEGNAVVYVYRPAASNPGKKPLTTSYPEITVDGKGAGLLKYNKHLRLELPAGKHEFVATGLTRDARWEPKDRNFTLNLEAGETYYLRLRVEFNTDKMSIGTFKGQYIIHLNPIAPGEAVYQIRHTKPG